jgi:hypothetical protein
MVKLKLIVITVRKQYDSQTYKLGQANFYIQKR